MHIYSSACGNFLRKDHMLNHKTSLSKLKKTKILSNIFSDHNGTKLENNYNKTGKNKNMWKLNNMLLNNQSMKKLKRKSKSILDK